MRTDARGDVTAWLGGREVRFCVTLRALARMESHFGVAGLEALGERLKGMSAADLLAVAEALVVDDGGLPGGAALPEVVAAVTAAFEAMHG